MKTTLISALTSSLFVASLQATTVAYYEFNGSGTASVGSTITDSTGNHNGSVVGGDLLYGSDALVGGYLRFDADGPALGGLGNRVEVPGTWDLVFSSDQDYTWEVIFRTTQDSAGTNGVILSKGCDVSNPDSQWWLRHQGNGQLRINVEGDGNTVEDNGTSVAGTAYNDGQWHHVAAVYSGTLPTKRLDIYVDGILKGSDTTIGTSGLIGGTDADPMIFGEFASLAANRSFDGDLAAIRLSDTALAPSEFLADGFTFIIDVTPPDGDSFVPPSTVASFVVKSPTVGVAETNIHVTLNGSDITSQLGFIGTDAQRTVTLPALTANQDYQMDIAVTDLVGRQIRQSARFDTFSDTLLMIEAEDYNFESGQYIDNPVLSSAPGPDNYLDRFAVQDVDHNELNTPATDQYRIGDTTGTIVSTDTLRQRFLTAQQTDPGVTDYNAKDFVDGEWLNYTRTIPAGTYRIYARLVRAGSGDYVVNLDQVTSGSTGMSQTLATVGSFRGASTPSQTYGFVALSDVFGNPVAVSLGGVTTLRATFATGVSGMQANYFMFAPDTGGTQPPYISEAQPSPGAGNETATPQIFAAIRNGSTTLDGSTLKLSLDGTDVTASATKTPTAQGATVSYTPAALAIGWHTVQVIFEDSAAQSITNQWQFMVANQLVRGYWKFNEQAAGNTVSTNVGAILDSSGNNRNGTANDPSMEYVAGSFNYSSTPALRFTPGIDRVVVPDPTGNFNYPDSVTFEAVVRTTSTANNAAILAKNAANQSEYWWRVPGTTGGNQRVGMNDTTGGKFLAGTAVLNDGNWHHVAAVYDKAAGELRLYADYQPDGVLTGVNFVHALGQSADLHIGSFVNGGSEFNGDIDFIRISNGALTPAEFIQTSVALTPIVKSVYPADGAAYVAPGAAIGAEIQDRDTQVVLNSIKLSLDAVDVTSEATVTATVDGATIEYLPGSPMGAGLHTAELVFSDNASPANSFTNTWQFTVATAIPVVALYPLDEQAPGSPVSLVPDAIVDASGNNHPGTAMGAEMSYVAGSPDYGNSSAVHFTTADDRLVVPDPMGIFNWTPTQSVTLEVVMRTLNIGQSSVGCLLAKQGTSPGEWWWRIESSGFHRFYVHDGTGSRSVTGTTALNDDLWHHVAAVYDAAKQELRLYVDYQLNAAAAAVYTSETNIIGNAKDLWIGAFQSGSRQFDGDMDMVRITGAALDPSWFLPLGGLPSQVRIAHVAAGAGSISFSFATVRGKSYAVESAAEVTGTWSTEETVAGDDSTQTVTYATSGERKFFRLRVE